MAVQANQACCKASKYFPGRFEARNGQKATVHWLLFKDYVAYQEITDADAVKEFIFTLGDEPRIWYDDNVALSLTWRPLRKTLNLHLVEQRQERST